MSEQQPLDIPQSPAAEKAYLASILAGTVGEGALYLDDWEFAQQRHQIIFKVAASRLLQDQPFDLSLIVEDLAQSGDLAIVTEDYLEELASIGRALTPEIAEVHGRTIRAKYRLMRLKKVGQETAQLDNNATPEQVQKQFKILTDEIDDSKTQLSISKRITLTTADQLRKKFGAQKWLWNGYIPVGHVTGIMAQQGQGKSNVALDICHRLALGLPMPDGTSPGIDFNPGEDWIFYLDSEGFLQGHLSRMAEWGTPDSRFIFPEGCEKKQWLLNTSGGWAEYESIVAQFRPKLIVVDSLSGANSLEEKDNDQMKGLMQSFVSLASRFNLAQVLVHHIRKAAPGEPSWPVNLDRSRGASSITQFCRTVLAIGTPNQNEEHSRRLDTIKNNLAAYSPALGFEIHTEGLAWGDAPEKPRGDMALADAEIFLHKLLSKGAIASNEVYQAASGEGIAQRTVERAKKTLNVRSLVNHDREGNKVWLWALPSKKSQ